MRKVLRQTLALSTLSCGALMAAQVSSPIVTADTILINGTILTLDAKDSVAEAVAIGGGKIIETGTKASVSRHAGSATRVIDLHGRTATPGLIDSHLHFASVDPIYSINLSSAHSMEDVIKRVRDRVATAKPGDWIQGQGWDEGKLAEHRYIYASDLDAVSPRNPVWLEHTTGHYGVANSLALKLAHITADTRSPTAGTIDRDEKGEATGVLKEEAAERLVTALIPEYSSEQMRDGYLKMMAELNKEGITAIKDPGIQPANWSIYSDLRDQGKLTIHLFVLWRGGTTLTQTETVVKRILSMPKAGDKNAFDKNDVLISGGVKLFMDGSGGARTAWMIADWSKNSTGIDAGNRGYPLTDPEVYRQQVRLIHNAGIHVGTHAIGDRAIDWVTDTYAEVLREKPTSGLRHSIIHANIPSDHAMATMAALEKQFDAGYPEAQAEFMYWIGDTYAGNFGPVRCLRLMPFHTYVAKGIQWGGGSDFPVTPFAPRLGIWASVARETLNGTYGKQPFGTAEAVDVHTALRSYTTWSAHQLFLESKIGSLEAGKDADIAIWDRNPYAISTDQLKDMKCKMTLFQGRVVYQDEEVSR
jgi:predicted amidohydrolase YtcJ